MTHEIATTSKKPGLAMTTRKFLLPGWEKVRMKGKIGVD
jgi:hypothetical protein